MGFPCFYATVADYDTLNDTSGGVWTRQPLVAPALFLEMPTVPSFFGFTAAMVSMSSLVSSRAGSWLRCSSVQNHCALGLWFAARGEFPFAECS